MAQALSFRNDFLREHASALPVSLLLHLGLLVLLALNLDLFPRPAPQPMRLAIQATVVDNRAARERAAEAERRERQAEQRRQREEAQREAEARRVVEERQRAEQQRQAQAEERQRDDARRKADAEAKAQAEARSKAEAQAQAQAQAKAKAEAKAEADARTQADARAKAEAKARAETERRRAQSQADLARQMAEEEALAAVAGSPAAAQYRDIIAQKVRRNWNEPPSARPGDSCDVRVQQIPGGEVTSAVAFNCTGDAAFARSVEAAVLRSSPLPLPSDPRLFERNLLFNFKPEK